MSAGPPATHPARPTSAAPRYPVLLGVIVFLVLVLGFLHLEARSLWLDEASSVRIALEPWDDFRDLVEDGGGNMSLYLVLLRGWLHLGESDVAIRSFSVICAAAATAALYALGARLFDARTGILGAFLLALNAFHLRYAQEARGYSLLVLLLVLSSLFFVRRLERPGSGHRAAYVVTSALALYTHFFAVFVLLAQGVSLLFLRARRIPWKELAIDALGIVILTLPLAKLVLSAPAGQLAWIPPLSPREVYELLVALAGAAGAPMLALYLLLAGLALVSDRGAWRCTFLTLWLATPILLALGISLVKPVLEPRYLIVSLPPFVLLAAAGLRSFRRPALRATAVAVLAILAARGVVAEYRIPPEEDWRTATRYVLARARPGDAIVFHAFYTWEPFEHYSRQSAEPGAAPTRIDLSKATWDAGAEAALDVFRAESDDPNAPGAQAMLAGHPRVWLVLSHDTVTPEHALVARVFEAAIEASYALVEQSQFLGVKVRLYARETGAAPADSVSPVIAGPKAGG